MAVCFRILACPIPTVLPTASPKRIRRAEKAAGGERGPQEESRRADRPVARDACRGILTVPISTPNRKRLLEAEGDGAGGREGNRALEL